MREILFRGKTKYANRWAYGSLILAGTYCCILESEEDAHPFDYPYLVDDLGTIDGNATPVNPETVGQFTGLKDKNGVMIFEGDIVRAMIDYGPAGMIESVVAIDFEKYDGYRWPYFDLDTVEIIGNIYDNPELLEVK